jgi:hypothetical protein
VDFILPAHGYVLGEARAAIARLKAHRLAREAKVLAAMQAQPDGSMEDWVRLAYDDVPERMWPVAQRSLLAHVERIRMLARMTEHIRLAKRVAEQLHCSRGTADSTSKAALSASAARSWRPWRPRAPGSGRRRGARCQPAGTDTVTLLLHKPPGFGPAWAAALARRAAAARARHGPPRC